MANEVPAGVVAQVRFVDAAEMAQILSDGRLVERLRAGSRDARACKGHFVTERRVAASHRGSLS